MDETSFTASGGLCRCWFQLYESSQSTKSNNGALLLATAASFRRTSRASIMAITESRVDDWELRCRFNRAGYFERWKANDFNTVYGDSGPAHPRSGQPHDTISQMAYYYDKA